MDKKDLTVLIVNDFDFVQGGASKVAIDTANLLYENGVNVIFFSATSKPNDYKYKQVTTNQKECLQDGIKGAFRGLSNRKVKKEFSKLLNSLNRETTIIHVHGWTKSLSSVIFNVIAKKKFKFVLTVHDYFPQCPNGGLYNYKKSKICKYKQMSVKCVTCNCDSRNYLFKLYRLVRQKIQNNNLKKCDGNCIYVSEFSKKIYEESLIKDWNNVVIPNSIDIKKQEFFNSMKNEYYTFLGRVSKEKGIDLFCEVITKLNLNGLVIGDGEEKDRLEKMYPNIRFVGWQNKENVIMYLKKSKVLVFTSLLYETMGMTALEAQSIGIPVIVGDESATSDYIIDNYNGIIFKSGDLNDLIKKIGECTNENISKMSLNSYNNYWKKPYSEENYINSLIEFYEKCR